jgi:hypothetical protein
VTVEKTRQPMIHPAYYMRAKLAAPAGTVFAFRPWGSSHFYLYYGDAVAFHLMFGDDDSGDPFSIFSRESVYAVPREEMERYAREAWVRMRHPVRMIGLSEGCDPRWFR